MMDLVDKVVLITGAGSGLGAATALICAKEGARTVLVDRDERGLAETAKAIRAGDGKCTVHVADLSQRSACFESVAATIAEYGRLDGLCNVAGITVARQTG